MEVVSPLVICIWRQESEPLGLVKLLAFVKGIGPSIYTLPCYALPFFTDCSSCVQPAKVRRDVKQCWWDADFQQRGTLKKGCGNSWFESHRWWLAGARVCEFPPGAVRTLEPTVSTGDCWMESI